MNACIAKMRTSPNHRQRRTQSVPAIGTPSGTEEEYGDFWNTASTPIMAGYSILKYLEEHQNRIDRLGADRPSSSPTRVMGPSIPQMPKPNAGPNISAIRTVDSGPGARRSRIPDSRGFRPACGQPHPRAGYPRSTIPRFHHPRLPGSSPGAMTGGVCVVSAMDAIQLTPCGY